MDKTFALEDQLPNLPVPSLETTIEKYLDSVRAVANNVEYQNTSKICQDFLKNEGQLLQAKLKEREKVHRNWIEKIWLDQGYLELRVPLSYSNFAGISSYIEQFWPPQDGSQIERMSFSLHIMARFWKMLREQKVEPHRSSKGVPFSMDQLRYAFSTCRIPHRQKDELKNYFKTTEEGDVPSHSIIIYRGRLFKINLFNAQTSEPYTPPQFAKAIGSIVAKCDASNEDGVGIAALTSLDRDSWADARDHMIEISEANQRHLHDIQSAIHVVSMDDTTPMNYNELMYSALTGDPAQRWRDKSYNCVWTRNGTFLASCDHTAVDGMVFVMFIEYNTMSLMQCGGQWVGPSDIGDASAAEELIFDVDDQIINAISKGKESGRIFNEATDLICPIFDKFGRVEFKENKIYPDAFFQICLQLAYMRLHGKPGSTYETATTRQYYHGRTETCRTCTPEVVEFCTAVIGGKSAIEVRLSLQKAYQKFIDLMKDCQNNKGCDRHLFALAITAANERIQTPKIFTDPMYAKSGGNGNFILSTSFVGFFNSSGAVTPMHEDGYGVFYRINDHRIISSLTASKHSSVTDVRKLRVSLEQSFCDVFKIFQQINESQL